LCDIRTHRPKTHRGETWWDRPQQRGKNTHNRLTLRRFWAPLQRAHPGRFRGGRGPGAGAVGPPWGVPGADASPGPSLLQKRMNMALGGSRGGPWGGPGGGSVGPRGPLGGSGGPSRGGTPRGAPWWPPSLRTILPFWSRPPGGPPGGGPPGGPPGGPRGAPGGGAPGGGPRGGPPGGHFWGVRTRWGQNQAKSSLTVVYRGGRGAPPQKRTGCAPGRGAQKGPKCRPWWVFIPLFSGRSHHVSP
jgi:hypothetical protein